MVASPVQLDTSSDGVFRGTDSQVFLHGKFASKVFHCKDTYDRELKAYEVVRSAQFLMTLVKSDCQNLTLVFPRYKTDMFRALMDTNISLNSELCCNNLLSAICYCHSCDLVHRDIKLENILIDETDHPVICDFSRSLVVDRPKSVVFSGTRRYAAPEALEGLCWKSNDVWSLAVVWYCMVERLFPFSSTSELLDDDPSHIKRPQSHESPPSLDFESETWGNAFEQRMRALLDLMFQPDYSKRLSAHAAAVALNKNSC